MYIYISSTQFLHHPGAIPIPQPRQASEPPDVPAPSAALSAEELRRQGEREEQIRRRKLRDQQAREKEQRSLPETNGIRCPWLSHVIP